MEAWIFVHDPLEYWMADYKRTFDACDDGAAVGDVDKVIAWVSTGAAPHRGDPMPASDLHSILQACRRAGLKRFVFHPDPDLGASEWRVISSLCGNLSQPSADGYWPSDSERRDE